jgi:membrane fusion protein, heavy metal efflux system
MKRTNIAAVMAAITFAFPLGSCGQGSPAAEAEGDEKTEAEYERGPHNGRMLRDGDFALEMTIFEDGVPPEFHIYSYRADKPLTPSEVQLTVVLKRLDGETNRFQFNPEKDYLRGNGTVTEPHSFDVLVEAKEGGRTHRWQYDSYEGRVAIPETAADAAGIQVERAGPAQLGETLDLVGRVELDPSAKAEVGAKFPGRVVSVSGNVGDRVGAGRVLARVESSESMQVYSVASPISGVIVERRTNVGDVAGSEPLFVIADPGRTTAVFPVFPREMEKVRAGQAVQLSLLEGNRTHASVIRDFRPVADPMTGALVARAALPNPDGFWRPGMSVRGNVTIDQRSVPLAVKTEALQAFRDFTVVFAKVGQTYEVRMLELGRRGPVWTEVLSGIKLGQAYASKGSYVIKADLEKSGASHDH